MDESRLNRIEGMLVELVRDQLPRNEFNRRFSQLERNVTEGLRQISVLETRVDAQGRSLEDLGGRMNDVEDVAAEVGGHERRKGWFIPALVNVCGVVVTSAIAAGTFLAGHHHG